MSFNLDRVLKFALFEWYKQKGIAKYAVFLFIFYLLISFLSIYMMYSLFGSITNLSNLSSTDAIKLMIYFFEYLFLIILASALINSIFSFFLISKALKSKGISSIEFNLRNWIRLIIVQITQVLIALFSVFKLRLLLIPVAGAFSALIGIALIALAYGGAWIAGLAGVLFFILAFILFFAYLFVIIHNSFRVVLAPVAFIAKGEGIITSVRKSWEITRGNVLNVFIILLIIGVTVSVIGWIVSLPLSGYGLASGTFGALNGLDSFKQMVNPVVLILIIPSIIVKSIFEIIQLFALVGIYAELRNILKHPSHSAAKKASAKRLTVSKRVASKKKKR